MTVSVVIPWRGGCPHREAALAWQLDRLDTLAPDWELVVDEQHESGPWCKAQAVAEGVERAQGDILVILDADCWTDALAPAVAVIEAGAGWVVPRGRVHRLTEEASLAVLGGAPLTSELDLEQEPYRGVPAGGCVVLSRAAYETAPMDERFTGWGQEDEAWTIALSVLVGQPVWLDWWPLWHLWHPPQERRNRRYGNADNVRLLEHYRRARKHPDRLASLVATGAPQRRTA